MINQEIIVEMKHIDMCFQGVYALNDVSITLRRGEVHALMGENGAGKTTLMKILVGLYTPTKGDIYYKGKQVHFKSVMDTKKAGISMIFQEFNQVKHMMVMENIYLGREPRTKTGSVDFQKMYKDSELLLEGLGVKLDPKARMENLTVAKYQLVEIIKAISYDADVIIMDEPTSALSQTEIDYLLKMVKHLCSQGKAIVFISHKLEEVYGVCDRVTILRDGHFIHTGLVKEISEAEMIKYMVDREISEMYPKQEAEIGDVILEVKNLTRAKEFENVSFTLRKGEILGLAGLMGAGRTEVVEAIMGVTRPDSGEIYLNGEKIVNRIPGDAIKRGIIMVPEDRKKNGLVLKLGIRDNLLMSALPKCMKGGVLNKSLEKKCCREFKDKLEIKCCGDDQLCVNLSGGNQQKVVVARVLNANPDIIILDEPTRGIDIKTKSDIHRLMSSLACAGKSIIMVSSELSEVLGISDRIMVLNEGRVTGILDRSEADPGIVMEYALRKESVGEENGRENDYKTERE
ncbi:MAG: sugar ABC transporter ATP-binding protein [Lachnospiraceae bacterium]